METPDCDVTIELLQNNQTHLQHVVKQVIVSTTVYDCNTPIHNHFNETIIR